MKRRYELKERAERQARTRQRITEATLALHQEVGPARTTVSEIARRAGVQRLTVYNNFPEDRDLLAACQTHFLDQHPPPDPAALAEIADPVERLRLALGGLYRWYRETEATTGNVMRDAPLVPALADLLADTQGEADAELRTLLARGFRARGGARQRVEAALALATSFWTWHSLARRGGLSDAEAAEVGVGCVVSAAGLRPRA